MQAELPLASSPSRSALHEALSARFGHAGFRPGQEEIVRAVLEGRQTLAVLPTGAGKSLCYQLPALLLPGTTIVVSPLIALMKDQVDALRRRGVEATFLCSALPEERLRQRLLRLSRGELKLCYVAPERFRSPAFLEAMRGVRVPLFAVDEAHCISEWGHDFRPDYARLALAAQHLQAERLLALTATATPAVRDDIVRALALRSPRIFVRGFDRPNLFFDVVPVEGPAPKLDRIVALAQAHGPGIAYAATRRTVERVAADLGERGIPAVGYHAGMDDGRRSAAQEAFLRGGVTIVATNAFGMGVDKPDVRWVVHHDIPRSVEAWYQEAGRAGRDGAAARAVVLFDPADVALQRRVLDRSRPSAEVLREVWAVAQRLGQGPLEELVRGSNCPIGELLGALRLLEAAGWVERDRGPIPEFWVAEPQGGRSLAALESRLGRERLLFDSLVQLFEARACRRRSLLRYFGEAGSSAGCSGCDQCLPAEPRTRQAPRNPGGPGAPANPPGSSEVFVQLRSLRTRLAREHRVPPYIIFPDAVLRELCRLLPVDEQGFLAVRGAGRHRWRLVGEEVLAVTRPEVARIAQSRPPAGPIHLAARPTMTRSATCSAP
jgi:ATP-dependent DNA helicase RecQ